MIHPKNWMQTRPEGLYCVPADLYIDPVRPVSRAVITHGHADHARAGHGCVWSTEATQAIMQVRYGEEHAQVQVPLEYQQQVSLDNGVNMQLFPAGHILGSAQVAFEHQGSRIVISGDYKRVADPTCAPFSCQICDVFVTEATFALPIFRHPPIQQEIAKLLDSLLLFPDRCHLVGVYALGKCQRVISVLRQLGYHQPIYLHGALVKLCQLYQCFGIELGELYPVSTVKDKQQLKGKIVLAPPSALADRWSRALPNVLTAMASGWMQIRARSKQRRAELPLIISDHADWTELLTTVQEVNAPDVWITHGRVEALAHQIRTLGFNSQALSLLGYDEDET